MQLRKDSNKKQRSYKRKRIYTFRKIVIKIIKNGIVLIRGNIWFLCVNSSESAL